MKTKQCLATIARLPAQNLQRNQPVTSVAPCKHHSTPLRTALVTAALVLLSVSAVAEELAKPRAYLQVRATRESAIYRCGEEIVFRVQAVECTVSGNSAHKVSDGQPVAGLKLKYEITGDGGLRETGEFLSTDKPFAITTRLDRPGFVLCSVWETALPRWWQYKGRGGAGVEPLKIRAGTKKPDDFDAFWAQQRKDLYRQPTKVIYNEHTDKGTHDLYRVKISAPGHPQNGFNPYVTGWLTKPKNAKPKSHPAMIGLPGAGVRSPKPREGNVLKLGSIQFAIGVHGFDAGKESVFYSTTARAAFMALPENNAATKEESLKLNYERIKILRVLQALRYLKEQPEWDGKTLIVTGGSQGGGLSLIAASLDPDVSACIASIPGYCDQYGYLLQQPNGWPGMLNKPRGSDTRGVFPFAFETAAYFDAANFARTITADTVVNTGFVDTTCHPTTVYAAFNQLPATTRKEFHNGVTFGHLAPPWDAPAFIEAHLKRRGSKSP